MAYESERDLKAKAKRQAELEELIADANRMIELMAANDSDAMKRTRRDARARLMQEREWYKRGHAFAEWPAFKAEMEERERQERAKAAELAKTEAQRQAEVEKRLAEKEAAERAEWEKENDPFLQWKRSQAARTF